MLEFYEKLQDLLAGNVPFVSVTIVDTVGSVPQNAGSKMLVTAEGLYFGTVGGGKLEKRAIEEAQTFLVDACTTGDAIKVGGERTRFVNWSLDKDVGMTCGGSTRLYFEIFNTDLWQIAIFGAGHCANALIELLVKLDCRITCYDPRQDWLDKLPASPKIVKVRTEELPRAVATLPAHSFVILMTMGHATDKPVLLEILRNWDGKPFPYLGVIGSRAKAARLHKDLVEDGLPEAYRHLFHCPVGLPVGNNHPHEIAISIAAQLLEKRDQLIRSND